MVRWLLIIISLLVFPYFEHLFRAAGLISLLAVLAVLLQRVIPMRRYLFLLAFVSIVLDVTFHLGLGVHLFALSGLLLFSDLLGRIFPSDNLISQVGFNILVLTFYTILFTLIVSFDGGTGFSVLSWYLLGTSIVKAVLGAALYQAGVLLMSYTRGDTKSTLRMR